MKKYVFYTVSQTITVSGENQQDAQKKLIEASGFKESDFTKIEEKAESE